MNSIPFPKSALAHFFEVLSENSSKTSLCKFKLSSIECKDTSVEFSEDLWTFDNLLTLIAEFGKTEFRVKFAVQLSIKGNAGTHFTEYGLNSFFPPIGGNNGVFVS